MKIKTEITMWAAIILFVYGSLILGLGGCNQPQNKETAAPAPVETKTSDAEIISMLNRIVGVLENHDERIVELENETEELEKKMKD